MGVWPKIPLGLIAGLLTSAIVQYGRLSLANVVEEARLFGFGPVQTSTLTTPIAKAWHENGKSAYQAVSIVHPFRATLHISFDDYEVMAGPGRDPPFRIREPARFCARLSVQRAGRAVRIVHAGTYELP